jgi:hypothetical protein
MMPPGRRRDARQAGGHAHRDGSRPAGLDDTRRLLDQAEAETAGLAADRVERAQCAQTREAIDYHLRIPGGAGQPGGPNWAPSATRSGRRRAPRSDFAAFVPTLEETVALNREMAECIGYAAHPYDALMYRFEPGETMASLQPLFATPACGDAAAGAGHRRTGVAAHRLPAARLPGATRSWRSAWRWREDWLRPAPRPPRHHGAPVRGVVHAQRRPHHHPHQRALDAVEPVRLAARGRSRALRAVRRPGVRPHAARHRSGRPVCRQRRELRRAREPVAPLRESRRPQPRVLGAELPRSAGPPSPSSWPMSTSRRSGAA